MHDKAFAKLVFARPQVVQCSGRAATLWGVVSRLPRCKQRAAPQGFLERQLKEAFEARQ